MKSAPVIAILALGGLLGWQLAKPGESAALPNSPPKTAPVVSGAPPPPAVDDRLADWNAGAVTLPRETDGHFYADVTIDGITRRMLVDTGASVVALTGEDALAMGYSWNPAEIRPVARGAGGDVLGVPVTLERVELGQIEQRNIQAIIVPEGLPTSLLGQTFLQRVSRVEIEPRGMVIGG